MRPILICDTECYKNYWLIKFYDPSLEGVQCCNFELFEGTELDRQGIYDLLSIYTIVTFNGIAYDEPMITLAMSGATCAMLKEVSDLLIKGGLKWWEFYRYYNLERISILDQIDIIDLLKGDASLKKYGARIHEKKIQELPVHEAATLTQEQMQLINHPYCTNDLTTTYSLYLKIKPLLDLRSQMSGLYGVDLRSKSDAQIAEAIIKVKLNFKPNKAFWVHGSEIIYEPPEYVRFMTPYLQEVLTTVTSAKFIVSDNGGAKSEIVLPEEILNLVIPIGGTKYKMGIGGLHSMEKSLSYQECDDYSITDADVTSYYPSLILVCKMFPKQLGERFLEIYQEVYTQRLDAKKSGDKLIAECFKIILNGSYGKLGNKYSILFAPDLMLKVTLTGQLSILMLIEMLEHVGIKVVSANTDGVVMLTPAGYEYIRDSVIKLWEVTTGLNMEYTSYKALYSRDVNNYVAIKPNLELKLKGVFAEPSLEKDPHNHICIKATTEYLKNGTSIEKSIRSCRDIREFITVRYCEGGAVHVGHKEVPKHASKEELLALAGYVIDPLFDKVRYRKGAAKELTLGMAYKKAIEELQRGETSDVLGKVVRFYIAKGEKGHLAYSTTGNKIADSLGAKTLMELPDELPFDIDFEYYISEAKSLLKSLNSY